MNKRHTEYIALYLFVFGAILLFGVMARKFVLVKGYDEFSAAVVFFTTVIVLSALYISLQIMLNELLLPRMEKFLMRFPAVPPHGMKRMVCRKIKIPSQKSEWKEYRPS